MDMSWACVWVLSDVASGQVVSTYERPSDELDYFRCVCVCAYLYIHYYYYFLGSLSLSSSLQSEPAHDQQRNLR